MEDIPKEMMNQMIEQAEREYPNECCGMILASVGAPHEAPVFTRVRPCENVYDKYHELDLDNFPRSAKTAYFIDPRELLAIQKELRENEEEIAVIYHSHMDVGDYFSEEDQRVAAQEGMPTYPGVEYMVFSIVNGKAAEGTPKTYVWSEDEKKYIEKF